MYYYSLEPNFRDDFNYPSLNRRDLMSLDTIKDKDFPKKKINQINSRRNWSINLYNLEIDKSFPKKTDIFLNKVDYINKIDDSEKARPNKEKILKKPNYILNVRDIEKAYPKKDRHFHGKNYFNKNNENKILTPQYQPLNNYNNKLNINENYKQQNSNNLNFNHSLKNNYNNRYNNNNNNIDHDKYNRYDNKNNFVRNNNNVYDRYNNNEKYNNRRLSNSTKNILTIPLDTRHIIQNQKDYKDTIHDAFNNYPDYINDSKPDNYLLNHHHDLIIGTANKNNRLDIMLDKSNKLLSYDFSQKININDNNKIKKYDFMNNPDSVKINRTIPPEIKNQGLEKLYKELDNYKPNSYEQHLDLFTHNYSL